MMAKRVKCARCNGKGTIYGTFGDASKCPNCGGSGEVEQK